MNNLNLLLKRIVLTIFLVVCGFIYVIKVNPISNNSNTKISFETFSYIETKISTLSNTKNIIIKEDSFDVSNNMKENTENSNSLKININTCSKNELITLPGIGEKTAENIIKYREENGGFKNISHIKNVKRIGEKTFEKIKNMISVD